MTGAPQPGGEAQRTKLLEYLKAYHREHGYMPQIREMAQATGMSRTAVAWHLDKLREAKKVAFEDGMMARTLRLGR